MRLTESLAEFACEASLIDLSPEAIDATKRFTLDTLGCAVGGRRVISSQAGLADDLALGPIDQVSFAVESVDAALPLYSALFGEFAVRDVVFAPDRTTYRGQPADAELRLAVALSGDFEIELVEVLSGETPAPDRIRAHGPGLHHVSFVVDDIDAKAIELEALGFERILQGTTARGSVFVYLECPAMLGHTVIELI